MEYIFKDYQPQTRDARIQCKFIGIRGLWWILSAGLILFCSPLSMFGQSVQKASPYGIFDLLRGDTVEGPFKNLASEPCWTNPNVAGVVLRTEWAKIQPIISQYDWTFLDQGIALAKAHNKKVSIIVVAGIHSPQWVYADGAQSFAETSSAKGTDIMPLPWDPTFQRHWGWFVRKLASRYDSVPEVAYITMTGPGRGEELYMATAAADVVKFDALGGLQLWINAAERIAETYAAVFTSTPLLYATGLPVPGASGTAALAAVVNKLAATYQGRFGIKSDGLRSRYPMDSFAAENIPLLAKTHPVGFQMNLPAKDGQFAGGSLKEALDLGIALGGQFIEVYNVDCNDPLQQQVLRNAFPQRLNALSSAVLTR